MTNIRLAIFAAVTLLHLALILFAGVRLAPPASGAAEPAARPMRLINVREEAPPAPLPAPASLPAPPPEMPSALAQTVAETSSPSAAPEAAPVHYAETSGVSETSGDSAASGAFEHTDHAGHSGQAGHLRRHQVSSLPVLPVDEIVRNMVYPPAARRLNIEGTVVLELFIDRQGAITDVQVLRETPANRGFGAAAVNAFRGVSALQPAEVNGEPVAVRFQYSLRFTLR